MKKCFFTLFAATAVSLAAGNTAETAKWALDKIPAGKMAFKAENGIFYPRSEFRHIAKGSLVNGGVVKVAATARKRNADPVAALKFFNDQLKALNIKLIVLPVPPKMAVYPLPGSAAGEAAKYLQPFYEELRGQGIDVLDMTGSFIRDAALQPYCRTDAHWSPAGMELTAKELAKKISLRGNKKYTVSQKKVSVAGDLAKNLAPGNPETESVLLKSVDENVFDQNSPLLVIGDSHTLIFSAGGDMLAEKSGICELLAAETGLPIDRIGIKGSAASAVRVDLFRKASKDSLWLKNKKVIIYCFSCREFTEAASGWAKIPVLRK